jgi:hypothetical protein
MLCLQSTSALEHDTHHHVCLLDILNDTNQKLFRPCTFTTLQGMICNYPVLVSKAQPICNGHVDLVNSAAKKEHRAAVARKRKAVLANGGGSQTTPPSTPSTPANAASSSALYSLSFSPATATSLSSPSAASAASSRNYQALERVPTSATASEYAVNQVYDRITQLVVQVQSHRRLSMASSVAMGNIANNNHNKSLEAAKRM